MVTIYWGINTNTRKAAFWMLNFILHEPDLYQILCEEIQAVFIDGAETPDHPTLLEKCPRLNAAWDETIRMSAFSASVRHVLEDTVIGGKLLRKGSRLMIPYRQLHFDQSVFGSNIDQFQSDRFLKDKTLKRGGSWRPFGGGTTQCPGRYAAKLVVLSFIAMLFKRFHVEIDGSQKEPEPQLGKPVLGIVASKGDLRVRVTPRTITNTS
jgi:cytochrome P450